MKTQNDKWYSNIQAENSNGMIDTVLLDNVISTFKCLKRARADMQTIQHNDNERWTMSAPIAFTHFDVIF